MNWTRLLRINLNMGIGHNKDDKAFIEEAVAELTLVAGQKPKVTRARKSISNFKLREGEPVGITVTLRGERMTAFWNKLINVALPRVRDFRGVSPRSFDGHGNYTLGLSEHAVFTEIDPNKITKVKGMEVSIVTSCGNDDIAREFLKELGMPFTRSNSKKQITNNSDDKVKTS